MFETSRVLIGIGVIVLVLLIPTLLVWGSKTIWKDRGGKILQIFSIAISSLSIIVALLGLGGATIWSGSSDEWAVISLIPAFLINIPSSLTALVIAAVVRPGVPRLRKISIAMSVIALLSPFVAAYLAQMRVF